MFVVNGTVTAFSMFNINFIGGVDARVLLFNATDQLSLLAIENASFVDFLLRPLFPSTRIEWFLYAIICLLREQSVSGSSGSLATVRMRNLAFRNITSTVQGKIDSSVGIDVAEQVADSKDYVPGLCVGFEFGSNLNASISVQLSGIETLDCWSQDGGGYQSAIAIGFDQQNSTIHLSNMSFRNSTKAVAVRRAATQLPLFTKAPSTIMFANCSIRNTVANEGNIAVQVQVEGLTNIRMFGSEISNQLQWTSGRQSKRYHNSAAYRRGTCQEQHASKRLCRH